MKPFLLKQNALQFSFYFLIAKRLAFIKFWIWSCKGYHVTWASIKTPKYRGRKRRRCRFGVTFSSSHLLFHHLSLSIALPEWSYPHLQLRHPLPNPGNQRLAWPAIAAITGYVPVYLIAELSRDDWQPMTETPMRQKARTAQLWALSKAENFLSIWRPRTTSFSQTSRTSYGHVAKRAVGAVSRICTYDTRRRLK